ncbi:hypothetical protein ACFLXP_02230 [Chloroflexota bacterium]
MIPKGLENVENVITVCQAILADLALDKAGEKEALESIVKTLEGMRTNFYLKTNFAIPVTNVCLRSAKELQAVQEKKDDASFPDVLAKFRAAVEKLLDEGKMEGVIVT